MVNGINHITFAVRDLNKSLLFYRDILGLSLAATWADGAYLQAGSAWIALNSEPNALAEAPADYSHIAFNVAEENFKALAERICSCGAQIWQVNKSPGLSLYFTDPDNHKLEIHVSGLSVRLKDMMLEPPNDFSLT